MTRTPNNIIFRKSFAKHLNADNYSHILNTFQKFCFEYNEYDAGSVLWRLTCYNPSSQNLLNCIDLDYNIFSHKNIKLLRNELRFQYKKFHPDFFAPQLSGACQKAFTELQKHSSIVVANIVYESCKKILSAKDISPTEISRIRYYLSTDNTTLYLDGISSLGFDPLEAEFLKPFHKLIFNVFRGLHNEYMGKNSSCGITDSESTATKKFETSDEISDTFTENSYIEKENPQFRPLSPENILLHKDTFSDFAEKDDYNILLKIGKLHFNLSKVIINRQKIADFLKAADALSK